LRYSDVNDQQSTLCGTSVDVLPKRIHEPEGKYYSEAGEVQGRWSGRLAEEWELKEEVQAEQYERLVGGQDPHTGEQLIRSVPSREAVNYGEEITTSEHRAGWDATFSAPKSVSLAALVSPRER
jgi:conjugative relaxase-like TrwC/TraI family protein